MSKGKTGLIVLTIFVAMFFLFVAILFGASSKRQGVIDRKAELDQKIDVIMENEITIYWIGEPPEELERLMPVIQVLSAENASRNNLPVKGPSFHTSEYNTSGQKISEDIPIDYPDKMVIVISGSPVFTEDGKAALLDAVAQNGVPVFAVGNDAAEALAEILTRTRYHRDEGSSLYYCLGHGYKENIVPEASVKAGGMDLAEVIPDAITLAIGDYKPVN